MDYLHYDSFSADFWTAFWHQTPEANWETRVPGWRDAFEYLALHYIAVRLDLLDIAIEEKGDGFGNSEDFTVAGIASDDDNLY